jgi:hypothetical protein
MFLTVPADTEANTTQYNPAAPAPAPAGTAPAGKYTKAPFAMVLGMLIDWPSMTGRVLKHLLSKLKSCKLMAFS